MTQQQIKSYHDMMKVLKVLVEEDECYCLPRNEGGSSQACAWCMAKSILPEAEKDIPSMIAPVKDWGLFVLGSSDEQYEHGA